MMVLLTAENRHSSQQDPIYSWKHFLDANNVYNFALCKQVFKTVQPVWLQKDDKQMQSISAEDIAAATAHLASINEERQQLEHAISIDVRYVMSVKSFTVS
jgi:hypothetical protein